MSFSSFRLRIFSFTVHRFDPNANKHVNGIKYQSYYQPKYKTKPEPQTQIIMCHVPCSKASAKSFSSCSAISTWTERRWRQLELWFLLEAHGAKRSTPRERLFWCNNAVSWSLESQSSLHPAFTKRHASLLATSVDHVHHCTFITSATDFHRRQAWISMDFLITSVFIRALRRCVQRHLWQRPREQLKWPISSRIAVYKGQRPQHLCQTPLQMCQEAPKPSQFYSNIESTTTATWVQITSLSLRIMRNGTAGTPQIPSASNSKQVKTKDGFFHGKKRVLPRHLLAIVVLHPPRCLKKTKKCKTGYLKSV